MFLVFPRYKLRVSVFAVPSLLLLYWCEGALPFMILFLSALCHEIGHLTAIKYLGYQVRRIDLLPMGAVIVVPEGIPDKHEWKIAISGPLASLSLAMVSGICFFFCPILPFLFSFVINIIIAFFNLMPVKQLDGGKALFCFLTSRNSNRISTVESVCSSWEKQQKKTERICSAFSAVFVLFFVFTAATAVVVTGFNLGAVLLLVVLVLQLTGKW